MGRGGVDGVVDGCRGGGGTPVPIDARGPRGGRIAVDRRGGGGKPGRRGGRNSGERRPHAVAGAAGRGDVADLFHGGRPPALDHGGGRGRGALRLHDERGAGGGAGWPSAGRLGERPAQTRRGAYAGGGDV